MNAVAYEVEPPSSYAPDRTVALLQAAFTLGMLLIWIASLARGIGSPTFDLWVGENVGMIGEHFLSSLYTLWLCAAIYQGRRWAFVGLSFQCVRLVLQDLIFGGSLYSLAYILSLGYCLLRLGAILGSKPPRARDSETFVPDRFAGSTLAVLDVGTTVSFLVHPLSGQPVTATMVLWFCGTLPELLWFQWSVFRSRGWAIGIALLFTGMGFLIQLSHPEQRLQRVEATLGFIYFGFRLLRLGPRPKGLLGIASP